MGFKRSFSAEANCCVEVNLTPFNIYVRDTKNPEGPVLEFTHQEWQAFISGVKQGEFDVTIPND